MLELPTPKSDAHAWGHVFSIFIEAHGFHGDLVTPDNPPAPPASRELSGLEQGFLQERERLLRFFRARGAGDAAEDLLQDLWIKLSAAPSGPVGNISAYLFKSANFLMIDRYRSEKQSKLREQDWVDASSGVKIGVSDQPSAERGVLARDELAKVINALNTVGERAAAIFRRHKLDGIPQREIADEFSVSLSTVESDLRQAYRVLTEIKDQWDEG